MPIFGESRIIDAPCLLVAGTNAPAWVKNQAWRVCDGTADDVEIQAAIDALSSGRTWLEGVVGVGTFTLAATVNLASNLDFDFRNAKLLSRASGPAGSTLVKGLDISHSRINIGLIDGDWQDLPNSIGLVLDGAQYCEIPYVRFASLQYMLQLLATNRNCTLNEFGVLAVNGTTDTVRNGLVLNGVLSTYPVTLNRFQKIYIWLTGDTVGNGIDFVDTCDNNLFEDVYLALSFAGQTGVIYNSGSAALDREVYENNFQRLVIDQLVASTVSIDGNKTTAGYPSLIHTLRLGASFTVAPVLQTDSEIVIVNGNLGNPAADLGWYGYHTTTIEHHTGADTLMLSESGSLHTNLGAGATLLLTLPQDAHKGCSFKFAVMAAFELRVTPGAAGAIYINGAKQTDNKYITADDEAESIELVADGNGDWIAVSPVGTWGVEA